MKFRFIAEQASRHPVRRLCQALAVSVSGYYAWRKRGPSQRTQANAALVEQIRQVHADSHRTYGSPRVWAALRQQGMRCTRKRVARLMRQAGLRGCDRRRGRPTTTDSAHPFPVAPNLLQRDFTASAPNQKWLGDISYIATQEGFLYLASLQDVFSRKIVGWAMSEHIDETLVQRALDMALGQRQPPKGLLHHSDQGRQFAATNYRACLARRQILVSMSRKGNCLDNAMKESFFATLKTECASVPFPSRAAARSALFTYIEGFYNRRRLHSSLGYLSPDQFERQFALSLR